LEIILIRKFNESVSAGFSCLLIYGDLDVADAAKGFKGLTKCALISWVWL